MGQLTGRATTGDEVEATGTIPARTLEVDRDAESGRSEMSGKVEPGAPSNSCCTFTGLSKFGFATSTAIAVQDDEFQ